MASTVAGVARADCPHRVRPAAELGVPPLCEASAAERAPWDPEVVLVADNEISDRLFLFRVGSDGLLGGQSSLVLPGTVHPDDIEALAVVGERLVVIGSHGRSSRCERRPAKEWLQIVARDSASGRLRETALIDDRHVMSGVLTSRQACLNGLFVGPPPRYAGAVCDAIVGAAASADRDRCLPPVDIEGAAGLPGARVGADERAWLGLRRPRVAGNAVMLRLTEPLDELRFDGVALIAVGDRGLRGLTAHRGELWAILGPARTATDRSSLWRAPLAAVTPGASIAGTIVAEDLPPSSEGLIVFDDGAIVITDGDEPPKNGAPCGEPAGQVRVPLDHEGTSPPCAATGEPMDGAPDP